MFEFNAFVVLSLFISVIHGKKLECQYNSREYQVVLNPNLFSGVKSFADGVNRILDELTTIEKNSQFEFRVSRSSLQYNNVTTVRYIATNLTDLQYPIKMKSRQKVVNEPADFVLKFSNSDPLLTCVHLNLADKYVKDTEIKFELDYHAVHGKIMAKSAMSYSVDDPKIVGFQQYQTVVVSDIFTNAAKKLTYTGKQLVAIPKGGGVQLTAEFNIRFYDQQFKATVLLLDIGDNRKCEFSFRIKGDDVDEHVLLAAQNFVSQVSMLSSVVAESENVTFCDD